jgi:hypothetical protein
MQLYAAFVGDVHFSAAPERCRNPTNKKFFIHMGEKHEIEKTSNQHGVGCGLLGTVSGSRIRRYDN